MGKNHYRYFNIYYWLRKISFSSFFQNLFFLTDSYKRKIVFHTIVKSFHWRDYNKPKKSESLSGLGSDLEICKKLILDLNVFIKKNNIKSILDLACGDFNWMKILIESNNIEKYLGLEIVNHIVKNNNELYSNDKIKFMTCDIINDTLPKNYDLVIIRDFFIHIKNNEILKVLAKIKETSKFIAINTFPKIKTNVDLDYFGHHRDINIEIPPFNMNNPHLRMEDYDRQLNIYT